MKRNSVFPRCTTLFGLVLLALLSGCGQWHTVTPRTLVGTLEASGDDVRLNGRPGSSGMEVYTGDEVSTGSDSEAYVRFSAGGFIHMSENTDPLFNWISGGACLVVQVFTGQVFMEADKACVETPHLGGVISSQVALTVTPERTTLTVIEGKVTLQGAAAEVI